MHAMEWIPVEERMPEEHDSIFSKFKRQHPEHKMMWDKKSDDVMVTVEDLLTGERYVTVTCTHDGKWYWRGLDSQGLIRRRVVAWRRFPEPYIGEKDKDDK